MSSQSKERSDLELEEPEPDRGLYARSICTGCQQQSVVKVLESNLSSGGTFKTVCKECCSGRFHNVLEIVDTVEDPSIGFEAVSPSISNDSS